MATASKLKIPVQGFRPQYSWKHAFALEQFALVKLVDPGTDSTFVRRASRASSAEPVFVLCASVTQDLAQAQTGHMLDTFTVTSGHTGTTLLFGYVCDDLLTGKRWIPTEYWGPTSPTWAQVYRPTTLQNGHVPNISLLRRTVYVYLFP
jgi:hypothetical protein